MKLYHFAIIFAIIAFTFMIVADTKTLIYSKVNHSMDNLDQALERAVDDAMIHFIEMDGISGLEVNKERVINDFFTSLLASLNIESDPAKNEEILFYFPVIIVTTQNGFYIYHTSQYRGSDGLTYFKKQWSEKYPYFYEDEDFIYRFTMTDALTLYDKNKLLDSIGSQQIFSLDYHDFIYLDKLSNFQDVRPSSFLLREEELYLIQKESIISSMENKIREYCDKHNEIAKQFGISYEFHLPLIDESEWLRTVSNPSILILFQGFPLQIDSNTIYNRFIISGAQTNKRDQYLIEKKNWYLLFHKEDCEELIYNKKDMLDHTYYTMKECASQGAFPCDVCITYGNNVIPVLP